MQIREFADFTGVSVRTLHYYDEIGLLAPAHVDQHTGYRYYDEESLLRMQAILFYRELDFSLKDICRLLSSPDYDKTKALEEQKALLILKKERLEKLISAVDGAMKGENIVKAFDNSKFESYKTEVRERWGQTRAYAEYTEKSKGRTQETKSAITQGMDAVLEEFALCMKNGSTHDSASAQALVKKLQNYISENFYTCTDEILAGLGQMYTADERFKTNIDRHAPGTAEYITKAINNYCGKS